MDALSKEQKEELATSLAALALYDGDADVTSASINKLLAATNNEVAAFYPVIFSNFLKPEKIADLITSPGAGGGGGGGTTGAGGGDAAEEEEEEKEEVEEEADMGGGMDMFGGGDEGDY
uniref:60S acidic ribosomal protein P1 n=1 Tax=Corethron hystrix TaxID=216773 RepID=A0A7S1FPZ7_9STRA|mmetsp:Transcript_18370/g.42037  ORF Transcript_18370/g.42037 Transcript_18370/m.42037 type:complete len:119 (+) Transcript_18370:266-622(+)|eukprot:CAMPEP_0113310664 /NCGR_PEP_ID=MMETSP0010_2-20120614/8221_1 /TAXON_ID=216773 ORGANISM="Corethron hystrix, Strain 308" /NCGR_SAMPLE_ID=MMETSP0010_2 /ASSEMBLY_ACC=CAM_ASM_000155 /LENGTH=118 /DNA_ID=CAMNT_0000166169 /DNA_START=120 /DNA_END=476 /DNA_ORIENTATION=- /assembly_acc=CAM_ASM_000155